MSSGLTDIVKIPQIPTALHHRNMQDKNNYQFIMVTMFTEVLKNINKHIEPYKQITLFNTPRSIKCTSAFYLNTHGRVIYGVAKTADQ